MRDRGGCLGARMPRRLPDQLAVFGREGLQRRLGTMVGDNLVETDVLMSAVEVHHFFSEASSIWQLKTSTKN